MHFEMSIQSQFHRHPNRNPIAMHGMIVSFCNSMDSIQTMHAIDLRWFINWSIVWSGFWYWCQYNSNQTGMHTIVCVKCEEDRNRDGTGQKIMSNNLLYYISLPYSDLLPMLRFHSHYFSRSASSRAGMETFKKSHTINNAPGRSSALMCVHARDIINKSNVCMCVAVAAVHLYWCWCYSAKCLQHMCACMRDILCIGFGHDNKNPLNIV